MPACLAPQAYVNSILVAGGFPLLVPPLPEMDGFVDEALNTLDGLILVGGSDVGASTYGAESHPTNDPPNVRRDIAEWARDAVAHTTTQAPAFVGFAHRPIIGAGTLRAWLKALLD